MENINVPAAGGEFLESLVWKSFALFALVLGAMILWRRSAAGTRHLAWTATFVCLLCLPVFVKCLPTWRAPDWVNSSGLNNNLPDSLKFILKDFTWQKFETPKPVFEEQTSPSASQKIASPAAAAEPRVLKWNEIAVVVWFLGMAIGLARLFFTQIRLGGMARKMRACENSARLKILENLRRDYQIKRPIKLLISENSASPMTWGFWKSVIALPVESSEWPDEKVRVVLRHELAHVKRRDCLTQEIAHLVCAIYWFNPLAWLAARRMRVEREKACDDFVLNGGARPTEYANHLVEIARQFWMTVATEA